MRRRNLLLTTLVPLLIMATMAGIARAPTVAKVYVEPSNFGMHYPGEYLTFDIKISDVVGLSLWEVKVEWNPSVINPLWVHQGDFLSQGGMYETYFAFSISPFLDSVLIGETHLTPAVTSGSGTLATVAFETVRSGLTAIDLTDTSLLDANLNPILHLTFDSKISVHPVGEVLGRWEEAQRFIISEEEDEYITLYAVVANLGEVGKIHARAMFIGFTMEGKMIKLPTTSVELQEKEEAVVSADFNAVEHGVGMYYFTVYCEFVYEPGDEWYQGARRKTLRFVVVE